MLDQTSLNQTKNPNNIISKEANYFSVTIQSPDGLPQDEVKTIQVQAQQTILEAALAQGINLAYACKTGGCGTCRGKITSGEWHTSSNYLSTSEQNLGHALLCCTYAKSDISVECQVLKGLEDIPIRKTPVRVKSIDLLSDDIIRLDLQLPAQQSFNFLSGQYIDILLKDGARRSYSIANLAHEGFLELHIRHLPGGLFTDALFKKYINKSEPEINIEPTKIPEIKVKDILRIEGPLGTFFLRESERPIIFLASGTGFAPIQSILKMMLQQNIQRHSYLYWGGRKAKDIYADAFCTEFAKNNPWFKYIPVLSDLSDLSNMNNEIVNNAWQGRTGFVHQAVLQDFTDLSEYEVYACGAPAMIDAAQNDFCSSRMLPSNQFFADAFINASTKNK